MTVHESHPVLFINTQGETMGILTLVTLAK